MDTISLGEIFLKSGRLTHQQLSRALEAQKGTKSAHFLGELVVDMGFLSSNDVAVALSEQLEIPYYELGDDFVLTQEDLRLIPEPLARKFCFILVERTPQAITIAMQDPLNVEAIDAVRMLTGCMVYRGVSGKEKIVAAIDKYYREEAHIETSLKNLVAIETERISSTVDERSIDTEQLRMLANDAPVVKFVNLLLLQAVRDRASDIHFEPAEHAVVVRLRVDGLLRLVTPPPKSLYQAIVTRIKILATMDIVERRLPQDGRFKFKVNGRTIDVRVSSLPEVCGEKLVLRILDRSSYLIDMKDIGFDDDMLVRFQRILKQPHGIMLLTGPTGSGKTTTLYSALNFLKSPTLNIQTVEDPVEYLIEEINQIQIKPQIDLTFANALRSILRQDPDIIMVGEIRDLETARIAIRAALTGHLVLSTLHTNDATSAFCRLRDIGLEPYLIAATVRLVISQRLVRMICPECKTEAKPSEEASRLLEMMYPDASSWSFWKGEGCKRCFNSGYSGRTGIFEFLEATTPIQQMVHEEEGETLFRKKAIELGMETLFANALKKVKDGTTTIEEVLDVSPPVEITQ